MPELPASGGPKSYYLDTDCPLFDADSFELYCLCILRRQPEHFLELQEGVAEDDSKGHWGAVRSVGASLITHHKHCSDHSSDGSWGEASQH